MTIQDLKIGDKIIIENLSSFVIKFVDVEIISISQDGKMHKLRYVNSKGDINIIWTDWTCHRIIDRVGIEK